jgi:hypothetical protein
MWQAAAWAAIGSAANVGVIYSEAMSRVAGGWPWQVEHGGPGGKQALAGILIKLAVSVGVVSALSTSPTVVPNAWTALVFGVGGPSIIKKVAQTYAENKSRSPNAPEAAPAPVAAGMPPPPDPATYPYPRQERPMPPSPDAPTRPYLPRQGPIPPDAGHPDPRRER